MTARIACLKEVRREKVALEAFPSAANLSRIRRASSAVELRGFGCELVVGISSLAALENAGLSY